MITIGEVMSRDVLTIDAKEKVSTAHELMVKHRIRHLIVLFDGKPDGILSDRNISVALYVSILNHASKREDITNVGDLCSRCPISLAPNTPLLEAVKVIQDLKISAFPITENGVLKGIITTHDLMNVLMRFLKEQRA